MSRSKTTITRMVLKLFTAVYLFAAIEANADDVQFRVDYEGGLAVLYSLKENGQDTVFYSNQHGEHGSWKNIKGRLTFMGLPEEHSLPSNAPKRISSFQGGSKKNKYVDFKLDGNFVSISLKKEEVYIAEIDAAAGVDWFKYSINGERYFVTSATTTRGPETRVTRQRDRKSIILGNINSKLSASVENGILTTGQPEIKRKIDLLAFDQEATFIPYGDGKVVDSTDKPIDALEYIDSIFDDLDAQGDKDIPLTEGDQKVVDQLVANLKRKQRASTVLLGGAGVGKTTLVKIALKEFPRTWKVKVLDSSAVESGTRFTGMVAQRLKAIIAASQAYPIIWFADEIHTLRGAGTHSSDSNDILEKMKPGLADGTIKLIGADTPTEFYEKITDPALLRRFTILEVEALTDAELRFKIHAWLKANDYVEQPHEVIEHIIETVRDFNSSENSPSREIGLLEACLANFELKTQVLTKKMVDTTAGVLFRLDPAIRDVVVMRQRLKELPEKLDQVIIGQDLIKQQLVRFSKIALANLHDGVGPRLSAFLAGVPGVGKTELAKAYAKAMNLPFRVIEMSRYGAGRTGEDLMAEVAQQIRENAFSVIIFDEIEKAYPKVLESLLTFLSSDKFTAYEKAPGGGRDRTFQISSRNTSAIMTSNAGSKIMQSYFDNLSADERDVSRQVLSEKIFNREWLKMVANAAGIPEPLIDRIAIISAAFPPTEAELQAILAHHLKSGQEFSREGMKVEIDYLDADRMIESLIARSHETKMSTRDILVELKAFLMDRTSEIVMHDDYGQTKAFSVSLDPKLLHEESIKAGIRCERIFDQNKTK